MNLIRHIIIITAAISELVTQGASLPVKGDDSMLFMQSVDANTDNNDIDAPPTVETSFGLVRGKVEQSGFNRVRQFLSIPYAAPPVGDLRWAAPQPPLSWPSKTYDATYHRSPCIQMTPILGESEDCLHLSIYAPTADRIHGSKLFPVMFWIHGGECAYN